MTWQTILTIIGLLWVFGGGILCAIFRPYARPGEIRFPSQRIRRR